MILGKSAQVILQMLDQDKGDENWLGTWLDMLQLFQRRFVSFKFKDHDRKKDVAEIIFDNEDYKLLDNPVFARGQKLLMSWGRSGEMTNPRRMIVHKVKASAQLRVICHCTLSLLDKEKRFRIYHGITDSEYVKIVAAEYGYKGVLLHINETKEIRETITQPKWMTDARMLRKLARRNNYQFYMDANGLHWKKRRTDLEPAATFIYRRDPGVGDILDPPEIEANMSRSIAKVRVLARDPFTKEMVVGEAGDEEFGIDSLGEVNEFGDPDGEQGNREKRITRVDERPGGYMTKDQAQAEAVARYRETAEKRYKMKIRIAGRAIYGGKMIYDVWGVADTFDGLYYAKLCESEIKKNSFFQTLHMQKDALREVKATKASERKGRKNKNGKGLSKRQLDIRRKKKEVMRREMEKKLVIRFDADGVPRPVYVFLKNGELASQELSYEEVKMLPQSTLRELSNLGAQSVLPDN